MADVINYTPDNAWRYSVQCAQTNARQTRKNKQIDIAEIRDAILLIDGFNLIISLEVALSGGLLLHGADGALRDLAGLRGSYHPVHVSCGSNS